MNQSTGVVLTHTQSYLHTHTHTHTQGYLEDVSTRYHPPHPPVMSRERVGSQRSVTSPSDIELQFSSGQSSREGSIHRSQFSPRYDSYQSQYPSNQSMFQSYSDNAPTRGSGELTHTHTQTHTGMYSATILRYCTESDVPKTIFIQVQSIALASHLYCWVMLSC